MIYYSDQEITIRSLQPEDADTIAAEEVAQGWINASPKKYYQRLQDQKDSYRTECAGSCWKKASSGAFFCAAECAKALTGEESILHL